MIPHPMERRSAEDAIEAVAEWESRKIGGNEMSAIAKVWLKILLRVQHHVAGKIESHNAAEWQILQQDAGEFPRAAAGIQQALVTTQLKLPENALPP